MCRWRTRRVAGCAGLSARTPAVHCICGLPQACNLDGEDSTNTRYNTYEPYVLKSRIGVPEEFEFWEML